MSDQQAGWMKGLVEPLRVKPGSAVDLPRDFDPGARFGVRKKDDGQEKLRQGVTLLAEYQDRLAAQDTYGVLGRPGPPGAARQRETPAGEPCRQHLESPLPGDQRLGALPVRQRHPRGQDVSQRVQGGTAAPFPAPDRATREELEVLC